MIVEWNDEDYLKIVEGKIGGRDILERRYFKIEELELNKVCVGNYKLFRIIRV